VATHASPLRWVYHRLFTGITSIIGNLAVKKSCTMLTPARTERLVAARHAVPHGSLNYQIFSEGANPLPYGNFCVLWSSTRIESFNNHPNIQKGL